MYSIATVLLQRLLRIGARQGHSFSICHCCLTVLATWGQSDV